MHNGIEVMIQLRTFVSLNGRYFFLVLALTSCSIESKDEKISSPNLPNIVVILADDLGYGDISALNDESAIKTPNLDSIINKGMHFRDAHSNSAVCTPTRYGLITGRYAWRSRLKDGVLWGYDPPLIEKERVTVASLLKQSGYQTACIGKWHLGLGWQAKDPDKPIQTKYTWTVEFQEGDDSNVEFSKPVHGPTELGFDYSYIIPSSLDMSPYVYLENGLVTELPTAFTEGKREDKDGRGVFWRSGEVSPSFDFYNVLDHLTNKAVDFILGQKGEQDPFFLYFPLTAPHTPWLPNEEVTGKSNAGRYGDFVTQVDNVVGLILNVLEKSGHADNTLLIVTSDNGSHWTESDKEQFPHKANYIFKGQKADIYEGGHRIPFIACWPGKIPANSISDQTLSLTDLMATFAALVKKPMAEGAGEDSYNMLPAMLAQNQSNSIRPYTIHHSASGHFAIRRGRWKLISQLGSGGFTVPVKVEAAPGEAAGMLFDLENDPGETRNVYSNYPEIVEELTELLNEAQRRQD